MSLIKWNAFNLLFITCSQLKLIHFFEFLIQIIVFYNFFQILKQKNFYYTLAYFLTAILFFGIMLIFYDFDIASFILWIIYSSVVIIFFIYSLSWFENIREFYFSFSFRFFNFFGISFLFLFLVYFLTTDFFIELDINLISFYIDYYELLSLDSFRELEVLGWGLIYYTTFLFFIIIYFFLISCCSVILIIGISSFVKIGNIFGYLSFLKKINFLKNFNFLKNQFFFIQEYDNVYCNRIFIKNFRVKAMFHKITNNLIR